MVNIKNPGNRIGIVAQDSLCMSVVSSICRDDLRSIETSSNSDTREQNISPKIVNIQNPESPNIENEDNLSVDLELEKEQHEWNSNVRMESFEAILTSSPVHSSWPAFIFRILATILMSVVCTAPWSLIPAHNVVRNPEYWYDILLPTACSCLMTSLFFTFLTSTVMNINYIRKGRHILTIVLVNIVNILILHPSAYCVWTFVMKYKYPVPFLGVFVTYITWGAMFLTNWFQFPVQCRKDIGFRSRVKFLIVAAGYLMGIPIQYFIVEKFLITFQNKYQPLIAMILPVLKEINGRIYNNYLRKTSGGDVSASTITGKYLVATLHSILLAYIMGTSTTDVTDWLIMTASFVDNIYTCVKIVWLKLQNSLDINTQINLLVKLCIDELVECLAPLAFMLTFLSAYYGQNSAILGNLGSNMWHYRRVDDIEALFGKILRLYFADFSSLIISAIILWTFCQINLLKALMTIEKEFKSVMMLILCYNITLVRYTF